MKNLAKKLAVITLSLPLIFNNIRAQIPEKDFISLKALPSRSASPLYSPKPRKESLNLKTLYWKYDIGADYPKFEWNYKPDEYHIFEDPSFYGGTVLGAASLANMGYYLTHEFPTPEDRQHLAKTSLSIFLSGAAASVITYFISDRIIEKRKEKKKRILP